jgi:hypothetical protein
MRQLGLELCSEWKMIGVVLLAGAGLGWATAATHSSRVHAAGATPIPTEIVPLLHNSTLAVVPIPAPLSMDQRQSSELAQLRARNRRLEALLRVMRDRESQNPFQGQP